MKQKGFTLAELMISVAIIGILAAVAIPRYESYRNKAKRKEADLILSSIYLAEIAWYGEYDHFAACLTSMGVAQTGRHYFSYGFTRDLATLEAAGDRSEANGSPACECSGGPGCFVQGNIPFGGLAQPTYVEAGTFFPYFGAGAGLVGTSEESFLAGAFARLGEDVAIFDPRLLLSVIIPEAYAFIAALPYSTSLLPGPGVLPNPNFFTIEAIDNQKRRVSVLP